MANKHKIPMAEAPQTDHILLERVTASAPIILWSVDSQGIITLSTGQGLEILGLKPGQVEGQSAYHFYKDVPEVERHIKLALKGKSTHYEVALEGFTFQTALYPIFGDGGKVTGAVGVSIDISQTRQAERALQQTLEELAFSEAHYRAIFDNASLAIALADREGRYTTFNQAWCDFLGYTPQELEKLSIADVSHPDDLKPSLDNYAKLKAKKISSYRMEKRFVRKDGQVVWGDLSVTPLKGPDGEIRHAIGFVQNITKRKKAQEELAQTQNQLEMVVQNAPLSIWVLDANGTITFSKGTGKDLNKHHTRSNVGHSAFEVYKDNPVIMELLPRVFKGELVTAETVINGRTVEGRVAPILDKAGAVAGVIGITLDITERKRVEQELAQFRSRLELVVKNAPISIWALDAEGKITLAEGGGSMDGGMVSGFHVGESAYQVFKDNPVISQCLPLVFKGETIIQETQLDEREVEVRMAPLLQSGGHIGGVIGVFNDITDRKHSEAALRETETRLTQVVDQAADLIAIHDMEGRILLANQRLCETYGSTKEQLLSMNIADLDVDFNLEVLKRVWANLKPGVPWTMESDMKIPGSKIMPVEIRLSRVDWKGQKAVLAFTSDISERKAAEISLATQERQFRELLETTKAVTWEMDLSTLKFVYVSPQADMITGRPAEDWTDMDFWASLIHPEDREGAVNYCLVETTNRRDHEFQYRIVLPNGAIRWVNDVVSYVDDNGQGPRLRGLIIDITEKKQAERALIEAKEAAEEAIQVKDRFFSLVAHDLRAPLSAVMGILQISQVDEALPDYQRQNMQEMIDRLDNMLHMIQDVLEISRLQTGKLTVEKRLTEAGIILFPALSLRYQAEQKGIRLVNKVADELLLYADPVLLGQVVQNLIANAIKFTPPGGEVVVYSPENRPETLAVKDNGVGIAKKDQPNLFRFDKKTTTLGTMGEKGTGLGLPLCHDIMRAHGGDIQVDSIEGQGSTFYAILPEYHPLVLVVDDDEAFRKVIALNIAPFKCRVIEASNGKEGLALMEEEKPQLVISDVWMPVLDGMEMLRQMRASADLKEIPLVLVTSSKESEIKNRGFLLGANDVVLKPLDTEDFLPRVQRLLS